MKRRRQVGPNGNSRPLHPVQPIRPVRGWKLITIYIVSIGKSAHYVHFDSHWANGGGGGEKFLSLVPPATVYIMCSSPSDRLNACIKKLCELRNWIKSAVRGPKISSFYPPTTQTRPRFEIMIRFFFFREECKSGRGSFIATIISFLWFLGDSTVSM